MTEEARNTLCKEERLHGRDAVENLFKRAGSRSMVSFPLRVVYVLSNDKEEVSESVRMLVSVPKKHFKRAVKRNRVKRQVREAFRKNKHSLRNAIEEQKGRQLDMAFVWLDDDLHSTEEVEKKVKKLLVRIEEKLQRGSTTHITEPMAESAEKRIRQ